MIDHQQSIRLQVLVDELVQTAINLRDAKVKHEKSTSEFENYVIRMEKPDEQNSKDR